MKNLRHYLGNTYLFNLEETGREITVEIEWQEFQKQGSKYLDEPEFELLPIVNSIFVDKIDITEIVDSNLIEEIENQIPTLDHE